MELDVESHASEWLDVVLDFRLHDARSAGREREVSRRRTKPKRALCNDDAGPDAGLCPVRLAESRRYGPFVELPRSAIKLDGRRECHDRGRGFKLGHYPSP